MTDKPRTFTCANCHRRTMITDPTWTEEDARGIRSPQVRCRRRREPEVRVRVALPPKGFAPPRGA